MSNTTKQQSTILGLLAQTSIHAGTGQNTGAIDLPIQREGHNGYPCIYGSAMKGALRSHAETVHGKDNDTVTIPFGPAMNSAGGSEHAGALMISDARILLLPVRSLTSQFKWVTCPAVLNRFKQDAQRFGLHINNLKIPKLPDEKEEAIAIVSNHQKQESLFLEEYRFKAVQHDLTAIIQALSGLMHNDHAQENLEQQLAIISNDMFNHISQHATPVNAHIAIDSETKVVRAGALWYEETLPPESLLYIGITANASRKKGSEITAPEILSTLNNLFDEKSPWLQVGGNETVGMGWFAVKTLNPQQGA